MENKQTLREKILKLRKSQSTKIKLKKDKKILSKITKNPLYKSSKGILFFMPIHGEPDLTPLIETALKTDKKIFLPRTDKENNSIHIHQIKSLEELKIGAYNIKEPHHACPKIDPKKTDLAFIPGVVFSKTCGRIGFGKGFYDRFLKQTKCYKIGLAYEFQIVENMSCEVHDVPMDEIITEEKTIKNL
ncbi:MAG: 5-formyltetrahydrofolate cyclo-ligase, 5-formyltetrahydrofolate cyclo-ligase [Candidatus Peregrinibacteria bacterium GW2011_GWF2_38_29]|nr:MAG: 5-formyltetrahydrofolate cyclo-ligase, 5-formyltetrahydrofolate cyclo-ligase [Candidatus Peregrinibacteria bacterium GW2011_GWF2_38_29]HBB03025.1 5-formyltetrahydrofolate cyclo-ligase [Candidatus Peregrinibacteria bacterium]